MAKSLTICIVPRLESLIPIDAQLQYKDLSRMHDESHIPHTSLSVERERLSSSILRCQPWITHNGTTFSLPTITTECPHSYYYHTSNYSKLYSISKAHHRTLLSPSVGHSVHNAETLALPGACGYEMEYEMEYEMGYEIGYQITRPTRIVGVGEWPEAGPYKLENYLSRKRDEYQDAGPIERSRV